MSSRRTDRLRPASILSHLGVMVAVAAVMGVLVAGLAIPFAAVTGLSTRTVADGMDKIPADLTAEPLAQRTRLLGRDGAVLATLYDQNRVNVPLAKVAPIMRKAIIAIEDYRFYQHGALDLRARCARSSPTRPARLDPGRLVDHPADGQDDPGQPGRRPRPSSRRRTADTYQRKINELRYAIAFEEKYSKDWILERYLNIAYFGDGAYGIEAASRHYFSKPAADLTLRAGRPARRPGEEPDRLRPDEQPRPGQGAAQHRAARMAQLNVVSQSEAQQAESPARSASRSPRPATAASRRRPRSSATTPCSTSSPTRASARPSTTGAGCCSAAA